MQFGNNINKFFFIKDEANRRKRRRKDASSEEDMQDMQNLTSIEGMKSQDILDTALSLKGHLMDRSDLEVQDCRWRFACVIKMSEAPGASDDDKWNGQIAAYELAVLLCQLGQSEQADKYLSALGLDISYQNLYLHLHLLDTRSARRLIRLHWQEQSMELSQHLY